LDGEATIMIHAAPTPFVGTPCISVGDTPTLLINEAVLIVDATFIVSTE